MNRFRSIKWVTFFELERCIDQKSDTNSFLDFFYNTYIYTYLYSCSYWFFVSEFLLLFLKFLNAKIYN